MVKAMKIKSDGRTITVRVPISIKKRGGRKVVMHPTPEQQHTRANRAPDGVLIKALARSWRWRQQLETGDHSTLKEIAKAEAINDAYVGRILKLSLLAPDIVEAILSGSLHIETSLRTLLTNIPIEWSQQRVALRAMAANAQIAPACFREKKCGGS